MEFNLYRFLRTLVAILLLQMSGAGISGASDDLLLAGAEPQYDTNSWQQLIPDSCRAFFDGCNNCRREPGKPAACTRKACAVYQEPRCLDDQAAAAGSREPVVVKYQCDGEARFAVSYNEHRTSDMRIALEDDEVMLSDRQTHTAYRLKRTRSASGAKYVSESGLEFFAKGDEALVMQQDQRLYSNCVVVS